MDVSKEIYYAGGCFWGVEEYFSRVPGVLDTISGYANSDIKDPSYEEVCSGTTGAAEAVRVVYDPAVVTLGILTRLFFKIIDPVSINRQGNDRGSQYRTGIYYTDGKDRAQIRPIIAAVQKDHEKPLARIITRTICGCIPEVTAILILAALTAWMCARIKPWESVRTSGNCRAH